MKGGCVESDEERYERVGRLPPEVKVMMAIDMTEAMVRVCAEGIKAQYPNISDRELMEKLRERLEWTKRWQKREG
jgi:hypothetical protein